MAIWPDVVRRESQDGAQRGFDIGSLHCHFFGHPKSDASTHQAQPHHEVILLGTVEARHCIAKETRVDKEAGNARDGVMLRFRCVSLDLDKPEIGHQGR